MGASILKTDDLWPCLGDQQRRKTLLLDQIQPTLDNYIRCDHAWGIKIKWASTSYTLFENKYLS